MQRIRLLVLLFFFYHSGLLAQSQNFLPAKTAEEAGFSSPRLQRIDQLLQGFVQAGKAPNAVTFVAKNGKIVHHQAYGYANLEQQTPLRKDAIFRIASQSKLVTSISILMLLEEGKLLLDDPVANYIPEFANPVVLTKHDPATGQYETRPAKSAITLRQLLTHTAGIPYEHPLDQRPEFKVPFFCATEPEKLEDAVKHLAKRPLLHDPGVQFTYGLNTDILGRVVEVVSGVSLDAFFREKIFKPLGMNDTYFYLPTEKSGRLVELYSKSSAQASLTRHENETYRNFAVSGAKTYFSGGAGLVSTAENYARLCQFVLNQGTFNGQRLLSRKSASLLLRNQIGDLRVWDRNDGFSLGLQVISEQSHYGDNATPGAVTWGGMYCSEYTIDPEENLILMVFTNVHPYAHYSEFVRKFRVAVYQALR
jgi:CubicO group peptidase (beta-lactamase class C family)